MSRNGNKQPDSKMTEAQERKVSAALEKAFRELTADAGPASKDRRTRDFVFHMTDWYSDLMRLARLMEHPDGKSDEGWAKAVLGFLIHASGHVNAAAKIAEVEPIEFDLPAGRTKPRKRALAS
jgi:hypothetical protein